MDNNRIAEPVTVSAGRGASWLIDGFTLFKRDWLAWIGLAIMLIILTMVSSAIPVANIIAPVISPIIIAGLMLACHQQDQGGEISVAVVFSGFSNRPGQLALIGVAYLVASIAIVILMIILMIIILGGLESLSELDLDDPELLLKHAINLVLVALIGLSLYVPVAMALWFAPALVIFRQVTAFEAMQMSIKGCLLNVLPFLVYGILAMILMIIASIPLLLGWLIMLPVLIASVYVSYKDIFAGNSNLLESTGSITP